MLLGALSDSTRNGSDTAHCEGAGWENTAHSRYQSDSRFVEHRPLKHREKIDIWSNALALCALECYIAFCHLDPPLILLLRLLHPFESCFTIWRQKVKLFEITYIVTAFIYVNLATQYIWEYNQLVKCWHQTCSFAITRPSYRWFIIKLTDPHTKCGDGQ